MITTKIKELQALQAKAVTLQAAIEAERNVELASLPGKYGFDSAAAFIQAVRNAERANGPRPSLKKKGAAKATGPTGTRKRAKITPAIKTKVSVAVKAGTSGAAIARSLGISLPSVHNIKKELGLVKVRKAK